ncbi:MAG TPA: hypothetical protein VNO55_11675 [Polyangia bacterium]|nr:hypothetical protein [Polyangia bacterium]
MSPRERFPAVMVAAVVGAASPAVRAAAFGPVLSEPIAAVASSGPLVAAITSGGRGRQAVLLRREGAQVNVESRWPDAPARTSAPSAVVRRHQADVDDVISFYDLADADRDGPELEELLDEEGVDEHPRGPRATPDIEPLSPRALVAGDGQIWMATTAGVWRVDASTPGHRFEPRGLGERDVSLIAAGASADGRALVAVVSENSVWMSEDDGQTWQLAGVATARPRALAIGPGGQSLLVGAENGLWAMSRRRPPERLSPEPIDDVAICDGQVVALIGGTLTIFPPSFEGETRTTTNVAARAIRCWARGRGPWIGLGAAGLASRDNGKTWRVVGDGALEITAAQVGSGEVWLGTPTGLFASVRGRTLKEPGQLPKPPEPDPLDVDEAQLLRRPVVDPSPWFSYLPRISVLTSVDVGDGQQTIRALMVMTIPLQRLPQRRLSPAGVLAAEIMRRRVAAASPGPEQTQLDLSAVETLAETDP